MAKNNNSLKSLLTIIVFAAVIVGLVRHYHIKNFKTIVPGVLYTSGQPRGMDYTRLLYKYHIGTFVNLRQSDEHREENWYHEEISWKDDSGVNYIEIPINKQDTDKFLNDNASREKFNMIMGDKSNWPVLIHGNNGTKRPAILAAHWLIQLNGYSVDQAIATAEEIREAPLSDREKDLIKSFAD